MRLFLFLSFALILTLPTYVSAGSPPIPQKKQTQIFPKKGVLQKQVKEIKRELGNTKNRLIKIGKSMQSNEKTLLGLENKIDDLELEQLKLEQALKKDQKSISRLILALQRIKRVPPEALIAKPDAPLKTAQSAMLMGDIIPSLNKQVSALKDNLTHLETVKSDLKTKKEKAIAAAEQLKKEEIQLSKLVDKRQKLFAKTTRDLEAQQKQAKKISKRAKNVKDLVQRLDDNFEKQTKVRTASRPKAKATPIPVFGKPQLPISGAIRLRYNQSDAFGAPSKGIEIEARSGSLIVVPMGGIVRFAGHFKNYGNMVIIEHKKGYHSLIAGFEKIDTVVGQNVSAGEPLGKLHRTSRKTKKKPTLYYELRHNGEAVNPSKKFADLT